MPPETCVRRRLVQSILFPVSQKVDICKIEDAKGEEEGGEKDEEDEKEECHKKRPTNCTTKKKCTPKTTPRSRAFKQVALNRKDISCMKVDEGDSPDIARNDFFLNNSEKGNQKSQQNDHIAVALLDGNHESCLPNSPTNKRTPRKQSQKTNSIVEEQKKRKTAPRRKLVNAGLKEPMSKKTLSEILSDGPTQQLIPNLWLEAKITAEENSRLFAGRQIHPFFSSLKAIKRNQEIIDMENISCSAEIKEQSLVVNPIHVFDAVEDDALSSDWGNWLLYDRDPLSNSYDRSVGSSLVDEEHVNPLQFDDFPSVGSPAIALGCQNEVYPDESRALDKDCLVDKNDEATTTNISCYHKWQGNLVQPSSIHLPENCLWTDKFQPRKAAQVCGNSDSVKFLTEWLRMWYGKASQDSKSSFCDDKTADQDDNYCCYQSDTDSEDVDETSLNNVLLVTGPVGSGKTAAIYACAEEQGFQVIEVNASDWRNGALVKQKFGEALVSHWLQHKVDSRANSEKKTPLKSPDIIVATKESDNEVVEVIPVSDGLQLDFEFSSKTTFLEKKNHGTQNEIKTLILFEDVDVVLSDDHGFLSALKQLAQTAKRPMILTANSNNPDLPSNLKRIVLSFGIPSSEELLGLGHLVCGTEKAKVHSWLIDRFVKSCQGDIRKTIMYLQFWCQGQTLRKGNNGSQVTYGQLPFDLQAGHDILPKLIPWGYTSQLSEIIEEKITKSLTMMEEQNSSMEMVEGEGFMDEKVDKTPRFHGDETDVIDAKKEAILSLHCLPKDDLLIQPDCGYQTSNSSGSPVAFFRRNVRRKLEAVISSDSEEHSGDSATANCLRAFCHEINTMQDVKIMGSPHCFTIGGCCHQTDHLSHTEEVKVQQTYIECSENGTHPQIDGFCTSRDVSCVPESTFVPETKVEEVFSTAESCTLLHKQEANSTDNTVLTNSILVDNDGYTTFRENHEMLHNCSDFGRSRMDEEEVGDSHIEHVDDGMRDHPMLDECSRIDSMGRVKKLIKLSSHLQIDSIEETWRSLRECNMDLRKYVTREEKDALQALEVISGMSNLVSEVDLLLSSCQQQICDSVEPSMLSFESSQLHSWCDDHLHMLSTMAQHGLCFYTKKTAALGPKRGSSDTVDLALAMLSSSTSKMALGKLLSLDSKKLETMEMMSQISYSSLRREMDLSLGTNVLESLVPTRAHLSIRGNAFHDYLASLSKISRLESTRLSEQVSVRKERRARVPGHYLNSGTNSLSPQNISFLSEHSCYGKFLPSQEES